MLAAFFSYACIGAFAQNEVIVSPNGSDRNPGTARLPIGSLNVARDRARAIGCHVIVVRAGRYRLYDSLKLDSHDSGLTIRAVGGRAIVTGGIEVPKVAIESSLNESILDRVIDINARKAILKVDLGKLGITKVPAVEARGFPHSGIVGPMELFAGDTPMTIARWPNAGFAKVGKVDESGNGEEDHDKPARMPVFSIGDRAKNWVHAEDPWLYGYWKYDWADESIRIQKIDIATGKITLANPSVYGVASGSPFFAENLLEELDSPGEYYIDHKDRYLYFILLQGTAGRGPLTLSILDKPLVTISGGTSISVRGLDFAFSRGNGVVVSGCEQTRIEGCRFYDLGAKAATIEGGHDSGLQSCDIWNTAEGGVNLSGGDRNTLSPARNFVVNCDFRNFERRSQTYRPAVLIDGVGNIVSHSWMRDAPHSAIIYSGNDHIIEFNRFSRLLSLTGDGGVVYTGRNWTARGTTIRQNWFENDFGQRKWEPAIYVDDLGSGIKMIGNLIERCHWGFLVGGGRDNVLKDNIIMDCDLAFDCDARGLGWAAKSRPTMVAGFDAVPTQSDVWKKNYPELAGMLSEDPMAPSANVLDANLLIRSGTVSKQMEEPFRRTAKITGNREVSQPSTEDLARIKSIRRQAGLIRDSMRTSLPPNR